MNTRTYLTELIDKGEYEKYAQASHETWRTTKEAQGWKYGPTRDNEMKTNPLMVRFEELPQDIRGQNNLTPYAVFNYLRTNHGDCSKKELSDITDKMVSGADVRKLDHLGEYIHSHFVAAQLSKGESVLTRNDMQVYENLSADTKSWDTQSAIEVMKYLRELITEDKKH